MRIIKCLLPITIFTTLCLFTACEKKNISNEALDIRTMSRYITSHVPKKIDADRAIRVRFKDVVHASETFPSEVAPELFKLTPFIDGKAVWEDPYTFRFKAEPYFEPNTAYQLDFDTNKLFGEKFTDRNNLAFTFSILPNQIEVSFESPKPAADNGYVIKGSVSSGIPIPEGNYTDLFDFQFSGKKPKVHWEHSLDGQKHSFTIKPIERKDKEQTLTINWNGKLLKSNEQGARKFMIPAKDEFKIMNIDVQQQGGKKITLYFSDPLKAGTNLNGLIQLNGSDKNMTSEVQENQLIIYPGSDITGNFTLVVNRQIENAAGKNLSENMIHVLTFEDKHPQIKAAGQGVIMPNMEEVVFPFEYLNVKSVIVEVFQIFENNVMQFLQYTDLNQNWGMEPVGRIVKQEKVDLNWHDDQRNVWQRAGIDISKITNLSQGAIYQIRIGFSRSDAFTQCSNEIEEINERAPSMGEINTIMNYYYDYTGFDYSHTDDPCYPAYYNPEKFISRNLLASNLGIIVKGNENELTVMIQDILNTASLAYVNVSAYDFQQQLITSSNTNAQGFCKLTTDRTPYFIIASRAGEKGYLKLTESMARSVSDFDVAGVKASAGFKGFIYGEREVWRPGDTLFLNFILGGRAYKASDKHPVTCTIYDPRGTEVYKTTQSQSVGSIYSFYAPTQTTDLTGNWRAEVEIGAARFTKNLKVEMIMPNRLKIKYDSDEGISGFKDKNELNLQSNWLHGAPAKNLIAKVEMQLNKTSSTFDGYSGYIFNDPTRQNPTQMMTIFEGHLNERGSANIVIPKATNETMPGRMLATIKTRIFEEGGAFSSDQFSTTYDPFERYTGLSVPENRWGTKRLEMNEENEVKAVLLDTNGQPISGKQLVVGVYESEWRWWWDQSDYALAQFSSSQHQGAFLKDTLITNKQGIATFNIKPEQYGSYLIRVCDQESGHCSGDFYYAGRSWGGDEIGRNAAAKLIFSADKETYNVGDLVTLSIPSAPGSAINISLENQTGIVVQERIESNGNQSKFTFYVTAQMLPNLYAHVDMIQSHNNGENDLPLRMYGIIPILIVDPSTILEPVIAMPDELAPEQNFSVTVSEKNNRPMAYTLAIVDEGLLDLTRAKTPKPHNYFFAKEALDIRTWDLYDYVLNNYGGQMDRIMSIGGGVGNVQVDGAQEANRFKPVVKHLGPFYLKKGEKMTHQLNIENYVGAVRTMVVAAGERKYGHAEKSTPVKKPLMVLATLPRKISPGETVSLPVNIFAMEDHIKNVTVRIKTEGNLSIVGAGEQSLSFSETGDQLSYFTVVADKGLGIGKVIIQASSNKDEAVQEIEINILNPNPFISEVVERELTAGATQSFSEELIGSDGTQEAVLEVYGIYPFNLEKRLSYLIRYPYGCLEQTISSGFPQLYVGDLIELSEQQKNRLQNNVNQTISRIKNFMVPGGGLAYWPGGRNISDWANSYAGHFLLEAKAAGYYVDEQVLTSWQQYQIKASHTFDMSRIQNTDHYWGAVDQAYRLYTLAKAGAPEFGAMNRLKSEIKTAHTGRALLAAAYALAGQRDVAQEMIGDFEKNVPEYNQTGWTYGSGVRDRALIVEALISMGENEKAGPILRRISEELDRDQWMSTQSIAFSLIALTNFHKGQAEVGLNFAFTPMGESKQVIQTKKPVHQIELMADENGKYSFDVMNLGQQTTFVRLIKRGRPAEPIGVSKNSHLNMTVKYTDMAGKVIAHQRLEQGTDFIAEVSISNPGTLRSEIDEMALQQIFPSGWEVINQRMTNFENALKSSPAEYQDVRDDRVYTFFDINRGKPLVYKVALNAAYTGRFVLPAVQCEAMYDHSIMAIAAGGWVEVVKSEALAGSK